MKVQRATWAPVVSMDHLDRTVKRAVSDRPVYLDILDPREPKANMDLEDAEEDEAEQERRELQDLSATEEKGDRLASQERLESRAFQVQLDPKVTQELPVLQGLLVNRVYKDHQGHPGHQDHSGHRVYGAVMA